MKKFLGKNFLLQNKTAKRLYHDHAVKMPVYDYHCHLPVKEIAENRNFLNLTQIWLAGDHYKWRAMRANGIDEQYITGDATDFNKFKAWAATVPQTMRNPLFHWTHLELKNPFGITGKLLNPGTATEIYETCGAMLNRAEYSTRALIVKAGVKALCTTDDPTDSLEYHLSLKKTKNFPVKVLPTFRPDKVFNIENPGEFNPWLDKLAVAAGMEISSYTDLLQALEKRVEFFHQTGCRISDHGINHVWSEEFTEGQLKRIFDLARSGTPPSPAEADQFRSAVLLTLGALYADRSWVMQIHMGAQRNTNRRAYKENGPDTGYDAIGGYDIATPLYGFMDKLEAMEKLPRTILYILNPRDNDLISQLTGCFQDGKIPGKIQFGPAWWFNDQKDGMIRQLDALSNGGLLSRFVGMLTDSRSFLSYSRHEYFRRILCNLIGTDVENGELPADLKLLGSMVEDICYNNIVNYLGGL